MVKNMAKLTESQSILISDIKALQYRFKTIINCELMSELEGEPIRVELFFPYILFKGESSVHNYDSLLEAKGRIEGIIIERRNKKLKIIINETHGCLYVYY